MKRFLSMASRANCGAEIEQHREKAVAHQDGAIGQRRTELIPKARSIVDRKGEIVAPICLDCAVAQPALVCEARAHRRGRTSNGQQHNQAAREGPC